MRHPDEDIDKTLERLLREIGEPDADQMEQRVGSVAKSLRSASLETPAQIEPRFGRLFDPSPRRRFAAAAVLVMAVAIGVYAAQRSGLLQTNPPEVAPAAQIGGSVDPVPGPGPSTAGATGAVTSESTVPSVARESRQPSRTAAEEIAFLQSTDTGARRLEFAAASVRREFIDSLDPAIVNCRGADGELLSSPGYLKNVTPTPQGRCIAYKGRMDLVIGRAFKSLPLRLLPGGLDRTIIGLPENMMQPPYFQINATAENPSRVTKAELQQMLQTLLIDRFKLRIRREIREMDGYVLTVAKSGIKFKEASGPEQAPGFAPVLQPAERDRIRQVGGLLPVVMKGNFRIEEIVRTLEGILAEVAGQFPLRTIPVDDKTGLKGLYEMTLNISRVQTPGGGAGAGGRQGLGALPALEYIPPLPRAFEEQLGLLLTPGRVPVEYLIVEHIEMPSEN